MTVKLTSPFFFLMAAVFGLQGCAPKTMPDAFVYNGGSVDVVDEMEDQDGPLKRWYSSETPGYRVGIAEPVFALSGFIRVKNGRSDAYITKVCINNSPDSETDPRDRDLYVDDIYLYAGSGFIRSLSRAEAISWVQRASSEGIADATGKMYAAAAMMASYTDTYDVYAQSGPLPIADTHVGTVAVSGIDSEAYARNTSVIGAQIERLKESAAITTNMLSEGYLRAAGVAPGAVTCGLLMFDGQIPNRIKHFYVVVSVDGKTHGFPVRR